MDGSRWTCFGVRVPRTLDYPTTKLNPRYSASYDHNACLSQIHRWTVKKMDRRINIMAIKRRFVLMNASHAKDSSAHTATQSQNNNS